MRHLTWRMRKRKKHPINNGSHPTCYSSKKWCFWQRIIIYSYNETLCHGSWMVMSMTLWDENQFQHFLSLIPRRHLFKLTHVLAVFFLFDVYTPARVCMCVCWKNLNMWWLEIKLYWAPLDPLSFSLYLLLTAPTTKYIHSTRHSELVMKKKNLKGM